MAVWLIAYPAYRPAMSQPRRQGSLPTRPAQRRTIACAMVGYPLGYPRAASAE